MRKNSRRGFIEKRRGAKKEQQISKIYPTQIEQETLSKLLLVCPKATKTREEIVRNEETKAEEPTNKGTRKNKNRERKIEFSEIAIKGTELETDKRTKQKARSTLASGNHRNAIENQSNHHKCESQNASQRKYRIW